MGPAAGEEAGAPAESERTGARLPAHRPEGDAREGSGPGIFWESSLRTLTVKPTRSFSRQRQVIPTGQGVSELSERGPMNFQTVRASLLKSTTTGLYPNRGVSAPRRARGRGRGAEAAWAAGAREGEGRQGRGAHLGRVAEEAESEAAAFELHLQGGAPGHGDPAPVVSREHADGPAPLPARCVP